jgi:hypothetical protein
VSALPLVAVLALVADLETRSPTLAHLTEAIRSSPAAQVDLLLRPPPPSRRAYTELRIFRGACGLSLTARIVLPPAKTAGEHAALLAHELSHVLDVLVGLVPSDADSERRALAVERLVRAEARGRSGQDAGDLRARLGRLHAPRASR